MELRSQSNCSTCDSLTSGLPFCSQCNSLKEAPEGLTPYDVMGLPMTLFRDEELLQKRFYELAVKLHPDKFVSRPGESFRATRWSTLLNQAYQTLRDPIERSYLWLKLHNIATEAGKSVPLALAEEYFELQDMSDPEQMRKFKAGLEKRQDLDLSEWLKIDPNDFNRLKEYLNEKKYLNSMLNDVRKKLGE